MKEIEKRYNIFESLKIQRFKAIVKEVIIRVVKEELGISTK